jgi:serine phosphatase RsbU (regulator of sigma subunit)
VRRFLIPLLAALAGVVSLALLFPRFDPSASLHAVLDRNDAIAKTRQLASASGVNTGGWKALAMEVLDTPTGPVTIQVALVAPARKRTIEAAWLPNGKLDWSTLPGSAPRPTQPTIAAPKDGRHVQVQLGENVSSRDRLSYTAVRAADGLWLAAAVIYFIVAAVRRRLRYRVAAILTVVLIAGVAASFWGGTSYQRTDIVRANVTVAQDSGAADIDVNIGRSGRQSEPSRGGAIFWVFLGVAAGISLRGLSNQRKWYPVELVARRRLFSRPVGWSVAVGLMSGIGIAAIPYWIAATGLFRGSTLIFRSVETLAAVFPAAVAWDLSAGVLAVMVFGFAFPLAARLRRPVLRWGLFGLIAIAEIGRNMTPFSTPGANLFVAILLLGVYLLLYLKTDLLATMTAMVAAQAALSPCLLLAQPGGSVRAMAVPLLLIWAVVLAASFRSAIRGDEGEELPATTAPEAAEEKTTKTGRMRLEAEFEVARKAQQDALPSAAPAVEGYSIAGSCEPAQQVGGDLYDYFPLADGRLGIAVADVSGKGVPAALYMMVTKGLLAATTRDSSDLAYIFQQINRHLYHACKKKVFVTLAAVALDPAAGRLQHGRAGHNPILWRRAGRGETVVLKPPGMGLGMTPGERFNRGLKIDELQLEPGDAIVLYSDGITEAMDESLRQFGEERLIRAVESADGQPAEESRAAILRDLAAFANGAPARDDVTLVVLRVAGNGVLT